MNIAETNQQLQPGWRGRGLARLAVWLLLVWCGGVVAPAVAAPRGVSGPTEGQLKAAVVYHLTKFVDWPDSGGPTNAPLVVGVWGGGDFLPLLESTLSQAKPVRGHPVVAGRVNGPAELKGCHLLFIPTLAESRARAILQSGGYHGILMVGQSDRFCEVGGMVNLRMVDHLVRLEINPQAAERAGLKISSKLLRQATIVGAKDPVKP